MNEVTRHFCWHQNFVPWGLSAPALGLYTCINHKKMYKIDFKEIPLKLATNDQSDKMFLLTNCIKSDFKEKILKLVANEQSNKRFLLTSKFCPLWLSTPDLRLYKCIKYEKKWCKIRLQRDVFETCNKWPKWQDVPLTLKFCPQGVVSPCPGAIYKIMKKIYKIRLQSFFQVVANDRSDKRFLLTSNLCPRGLSAPDLQLYTFIKSCIKSEVEEILFKLATNDYSDEAFLLT